MSKFKVGDTVRVTETKSYMFDQVGVICRPHSADHSRWIVDFNGALWGCVESTLTLADPDVHTVLDQMDAESAPVDHAAVLDALAKEVAAETITPPCFIRVNPEDLTPDPSFPQRFTVGMDEREIDGEYVRGKACVSELPKTGVTAEDKLRLIADTVEGQAPFGTELANFRRRVSAILSIGHDV